MHFQGGDSPKERPGWLHAPFGRRPVQSPKNSLTLDFSSPHPPHQGIRPRPNATCNTTCRVATNTASCPSSHPLPHSPRTNRKVLPGHTPKLKLTEGSRVGLVRDKDGDQPSTQVATSPTPSQLKPQQCIQGETNRKGDGAGKGWRAGRQSAGQAEALADSKRWGPPTYHTDTG